MLVESISLCRLDYSRLGNTNERAANAATIQTQRHEQAVYCSAHLRNLPRVTQWETLKFSSVRVGDGLGLVVSALHTLTKLLYELRWVTDREHTICVCNHTLGPTQSPTTCGPAATFGSFCDRRTTEVEAGLNF